MVPQGLGGRVCWHMPVIPAYGMLRQVDCFGLEASQSHKASSMPVLIVH